MKQDDGKKPREVLATDGEASAAGYAEAEVPAGNDCPTIDRVRVRIVPPSQTPTVRVGDVVKGAGPRAPEQTVKPKAKGPVELPEGRPVTKMQLIEVDPELLLELERGLGAEVQTTASEETSGGRVESPWVKEAGAAVAAAELPSAGAPPVGPGSEPAVKMPARKMAAMGGAVLGVAVVVGVVVATRGAMRPEQSAARPSATVTPSATITVASAASAATVASAATSTTTPSVPAAPSARASVAAPSVRPRATAAEKDPYEDAPVPAPPVAPPTAPLAPLPSPDKTPARALPGGDKTEF